MTERIDQEKYAEHLNDVFRISLDDDSALDITLIEVNSAGSQSTQHALDAGRPAPFSILFRGPAEPVLPQAIYQLSHAALGAQDLFLVPIGPDGEGMAYEAVFT